MSPPDPEMRHEDRPTDAAQAGNGFDARNDDVWWADRGQVVVAATPLPTGVPVTLTSTDLPLQMSPATALTITLSD